MIIKNKSREEIEGAIKVVDSMSKKEIKYTKKNIFNTMHKVKKSIWQLRKERDISNLFVEYGLDEDNLEDIYHDRIFEKYMEYKQLEMTLFALVYRGLMKREECELHLPGRGFAMLNSYKSELERGDSICTFNPLKGETIITNGNDKLIIKSNKK